MRRVRLRAHLVVLVVATLIPVIALAVALLVRSHESNRAAVERGMRETVRALAFTAPPALVTRVLKAQRLPAEWFGVVYDANRLIIARTRDEERALGQRADGNPANETAAEGFFRTTSREGQGIYFAYARVPS